ncbi:MAG: nuclear transport factor 2 family protein [SAR324 cluster bacterium]|nr:nuclear transport factor 2 family protein [SAR324 cluster bacterium]MCZ6557916.1 nuclear transport factor 2 family protein [SAR324 cluster bacterium]MCZ6629152.1 nuclear transport factor 2 family protein [SAR324 cluster bacterium]MCZ6644721.1 nuclear transport factor 2 family protein [SAR324 cluster bacterium]MCZ6729487.1 nuclear transport factor 2 family protein [SAR324 cluster bacterium]
MTDAATHLEALQRMGEGFNSKDVELILSNFTEDAVFETTQGEHPWGERFTGHEEIRESILNVWNMLPDLQFSDTVRFVCGDRGVAEWTCTGTTPKGHPMKVRGCDLFTFRDGKVARKDTYFKQVIRQKD